MGAWKINDKQWMKARKESWKPIKKVLLKTERLTRDRIKPLQDYYLNGKEPEIIPPPWDDEYFFMIFKLWLHADQSENNWLKIIRATSKKDYENSRGIFKCETGNIWKHVDGYGYMGGMEPRFGELFFPDNMKREYYRSENIDLSPFELEETFNPHRFFTQWQMDLSPWLTYHAAPRHHWLEFATCHIWHCLPNVDSDSLMGRSELNPYSYLRDILCQCAHYIEPRDMPGENTPQRRLAEYLRQELDKRPLPPFLAEQWEIMKSRQGRNYWVKYKVGKDDYDDTSDMAGHVTYVLHAPQCDNELIPRLVTIFQRLGFTQENFDAERIDVVDLGKSLTLPMIKRLGYMTGQAIPAYRYRIITNDTYMDDDHARVNVDLIKPIRHPELKPEPGTPAILCVPRPNDNFTVFPALAYQLNLRMGRRIFTAETGLELQRYIDLNKWYRKEKIEFERKDPFYDADYQPMVNFRMPILDRPEDDFPAWKGDPLPKLFG